MKKALSIVSKARDTPRLCADAENKLKHLNQLLERMERELDISKETDDEIKMFSFLLRKLLNKSRIRIPKMDETTFLKGLFFQITVSVHKSITYNV